MLSAQSAVYQRLLPIYEQILTVFQQSYHLIAQLQQDLQPENVPSLLAPTPHPVSWQRLQPSNAQTRCTLKAAL